MARNKRTVVPSGHGVGKTYNAAHIVLWFLCSFKNSKVITTAPTFHQVKNLLWSEVHSAYNSAEYAIGGRLTTTKLEFARDWYAIGMSTKEDGENREFGATKFQGFHAEHLLAVIDEGAGVADEIFTAIESLIVSSNNRLLAIGNPASPTGPFYEACRSPLWNKVTISCFDHPNVKEGREVVPGAVTREWIEDMRIKWGEGSPLWQAKVLGEFPEEGDDTLFPLTWLERAIDREVSGGRKRIAVDVARYGTDETVFCQMEGRKVTELTPHKGHDTMRTTGEVVTRVKNGGNYDFIIVDGGGLGAGVVDRLDELGYDVEDFNFGSEAIDKERFFNRRAEIYWMLHEAFKDGDISIPDDPVLVNQLSKQKYEIDSRGRIKLPSKDEMRKKGIPSPDRADALAMCNAYSAKFEEDGEIGFLA